MAVHIKMRTTRGPMAPAGRRSSPAWPAARARRAAVAVVVILALAALTACQVRIVQIGRSRTPRSAAAVARRVDPRLVDVVSTLGFLHRGAAGTGIVLTPGDEVLTNNHVIEGATAVTITDLGNGRTYQATVIGYDERADLAVLRLRGASGLRALTASSRRIKLGEKVIALGNAGGLGGNPAVAIGKITGLRESILARDAAAGTTEQLSGLIRSNVRLAPGDSGGPLLSTSGRLLGIDTAAAVGFHLMSGASEGFAIPIGRALRIARQIQAGRSSAVVHIGPTGFLGVQLTPARRAGAGALVVGVIPGLPAARAGLAAGDVIVSAGGRRVSSPSALAASLVPLHPGDSLTLTWADKAGRTHSATVELATGPAA
jgi:S1-C subfamily serine protease